MCHFNLVVYELLHLDCKSITIKWQNGKNGIVIAYDSRHHSQEFAQEAAKVLTSAGIPVKIFTELQPTPVLSVFCQADFPFFVVGIPHRHRGKIPTFSGPCQEAGSTTASCRMRACSIR